MFSSFFNSKYDHEPSILLNKLEVDPQLNALEECFKSYILCRYKNPCTRFSFRAFLSFTL